jgi:N6-L-threonylcarbamoyladenine synthase
MSARQITVLGLESSCDETAAAVVRLSLDAQGRLAGPGEILSNRVLSQIELHAPYGGVVPEIAARAHITHMDGLVRQALHDAELSLEQVDAVAATAGPGLIGGVLIGLTTGKALALAAGKPFLGINHLEGHALTVRMTQGVAFPYLLLLVSGGHCQLLGVTGLGQYQELGSTMDDAVGEAFDKAAKLLSLGYPGGPEIERWAKDGNPEAYPLPRPLIDRHNLDTGSGAELACEFSFSGLKTALRQKADKLAPLSDAHVRDLAASFQAAVMDCLADRTRNAMQVFRMLHNLSGEIPLVVAGGVAANQALRARLETEASTQDYCLCVPPPALCTDNAAMIAWAGAERMAGAEQVADAMATPAQARWPLADLTA